jgi:hypothetical protein
MGNLLSLHRDILRKIYREYLSYPDRIPLLNAVGVNYRSKDIGCEYILGEYACNGYLELLKWYINNEKICIEEFLSTKSSDRVYLIARIFKGGHIHVLDWLYKVHPDSITSYSYYKAIYYNHLDILIWLHSLKIEVDLYCLVTKSIECNRLELLKWIKETHHNNWSKWNFWTAEMNMCIIHNRYEIFVWFAEQYISLDHSGEEKRKFINACDSCIDSNLNDGLDNSEVIKIKTYLGSLI